MSEQRRAALPGGDEVAAFKGRLDRAKAVYAERAARGEDVEFWNLRRIQLANALAIAIADARARARSVAGVVTGVVTRQRGRAPGRRPGHRRTRRSSRDGPPPVQTTQAIGGDAP